MMVRLHHMVYEVVDNAIDEALLATHAVKWSSTPTVPSRARHGRGIPVDITRRSISRRVIMTQLHAGGKFDQITYKVSAACTASAFVVNALSSKLQLRSGATARSICRVRHGDALAP